MIHAPSKKDKARLKVLEWPLPRQLLPWLRWERGLRTVILPADVGKAWWYLKTHHGYKKEKMPKDGRRFAETSHYHPDYNLLVLTQKALWSKRASEIFMHEVGHAVDFLYDVDNGHCLSSYAKIVDYLCMDNPLDSYCEKKYKETGRAIEQFATAFAAYFTEPEANSSSKSVDDLSESFIAFCNRYFMEAFK